MDGGQYSGAIKDSHTTLTPLMSKFCSSSNGRKSAESDSCEASAGKEDISKLCD